MGVITAYIDNANKTVEKSHITYEFYTDKSIYMYKREQ